MDTIARRSYLSPNYFCEVLKAETEVTLTEYLMRVRMRKAKETDLTISEISDKVGYESIHAAGVGPGDEVIVPSYTWYASIGPILHSNAIPVSCEVDPHTLTADPEDIRKKITPRTKAICGGTWPRWMR